MVQERPIENQYLPLRARPHGHLDRYIGRGDLGFELFMELVHDGSDGPVVPVREATDRGAGHGAHARRHFKSEIKVFGLGIPVVNLAEQLEQPSRAFAAGRALATTFMPEEPADITGDRDHVGVFVEDGRAGGAEPEDIVFSSDIKIEFGIELVRAEDTHRDPAGDSAFVLLATAHTAAVFLDDGAERDAQFKLIDTGSFDMPGDTHEFGPEAGRTPDATLNPLFAEPFCAVFHDTGQMGERFDIVDDGGLAEEPFDGGEGWFDARPSSFALDRFE